MTAPLDWSLPIYTVPDERNPEPVRCEVERISGSGKLALVKTPKGGPYWYNSEGVVIGIITNRLPRLQNLPSKWRPRDD